MTNGDKVREILKANGKEIAVTDDELNAIFKAMYDTVYIHQMDADTGNTLWSEEYSD